MPEQSDHWRRALELLASSPEGVSEALLIAHGFRPEIIVWLVDTGLATLTTEHVSAAGRRYELPRFKITERGRVALER
jgi:hypothetical protein